MSDDRKPKVFSGIQPTGKKTLGNYSGGFRQYVQTQEVGDEDQALPARREGIVLQLHVVADRPEIIPEVGFAGGLDTGENAGLG